MGQWGERVAVPSGRTLSSSSRTASGGLVAVPSSSTNYTRESLGTLISATSRVDESGLIVIELNMEQTRMAADTEVKLDPSDPDASVLLKPVTRTLKTVVSVPDGETVVLCGMTTRSGKQHRQDAILVTARVTGAKAVKAAARTWESPSKAQAAVANVEPVPDRPPTAAATREAFAFGSRDSSASTADRYRSLAQAMIQRYDTNQDGKLNVNEFKAYSRAPANTDRNGDGIVALDELIRALGER
jgi:hypothetical protein